MLYKLIGMAVWHGGKLFLRRRYGSTYVPKAVLAGGALALVAGAVLVVLGARRASSD
jgi:hypothetical protein